MRGFLFQEADMAKSDTTSTETITFADKAFKSRTVVLEDGRSFPVEKSRIAASDPVLIAYLDKRADFERVAAGA